MIGIYKAGILEILVFIVGTFNHGGIHLFLHDLTLATLGVYLVWCTPRGCKRGIKCVSALTPTHTMHFFFSNTLHKPTNVVPTLWSGPMGVFHKLITEYVGVLPIGIQGKEALITKHHIIVVVVRV